MSGLTKRFVSREVSQVIDSSLARCMEVIRRKLFRLRLRFRFLMFVEAGLLLTTGVLLISTVAVAVGKIVYLPEVLRSSLTLVRVLEAVVVVSLLWAALRPVHDSEVASLIDSEIAQPGMMESAVDFLTRSDEIDPLYFRPFIERTARILDTTPNRDIVGIKLPSLWRYAAVALALLLVVHIFVPIARLVDEDQDPFLFRDLHRLSIELEGAVLNAERQDSISEEERELFKKAEQLARRMRADSVDPSYLQDELLRLTKGVNERSVQTRAATDSLLEQLLSEIERLRKEGSDNEELQQVLNQLASRARDMQGGTLQQQVTGASEIARIIDTPMGEFGHDDVAALRRLIEDMQSGLQQNSAAHRLTDVAQRSLKALSRDSLDDLMPAPRDGLSKHLRDYLRQLPGAQPDSLVADDQGDQSGESYLELIQASEANGGTLLDGDSQAGGGLGLLAIDQDGSGSTSQPAGGIGTATGQELLGDRTAPVEGYRTAIDHRLVSDSDEMDLTLSAVLGAPAEGEVQMHAPDELQTFSGAAYEGQILEGEYPERYKQIVSNYFDGLK